MPNLHIHTSRLTRAKVHQIILQYGHQSAQSIAAQAIVRGERKTGVATNNRLNDASVEIQKVYRALTNSPNRYDHALAARLKKAYPQSLSEHDKAKHTHVRRTQKSSIRPWTQPLEAYLNTELDKCDLEESQKNKLKRIILRGKLPNHEGLASNVFFALLEQNKAAVRSIFYLFILLDRNCVGNTLTCMGAIEELTTILNRQSALSLALALARGTTRADTARTFDACARYADILACSKIPSAKITDLIKNILRKRPCRSVDFEVQIESIHNQDGKFLTANEVDLEPIRSVPAVLTSMTIMQQTGTSLAPRSDLESLGASIEEAFQSAKAHFLDVDHHRYTSLPSAAPGHQRIASLAFKACDYKANEALILDIIKRYLIRNPYFDGFEIYDENGKPLRAVTQLTYAPLT